ncbi:MAG TPA: hypothetical protein VF395_17255 [Polyangiaceae bacterium]
MSAHPCPAGRARDGPAVEVADLLREPAGEDGGGDASLRYEVIPERTLGAASS